MEDYNEGDFYLNRIEDTTRHGFNFKFAANRQLSRKQTHGWHFYRRFASSFQIKWINFDGEKYVFFFFKHRMPCSNESLSVLHFSSLFAMISPDCDFLFFLASIPALQQNNQPNPEGSLRWSFRILRVFLVGFQSLKRKLSMHVLFFRKYKKNRKWVPTNKSSCLSNWRPNAKQINFE